MNTNIQIAAMGEGVLQPFYPSVSTVIGRVLGSLLSSERLTHMDCLLRYSSSRLAHHIYQLKKYGWRIERDDEEVKTSDADRVAEIAVYFMTAEQIDDAGADGQSYSMRARATAFERKRAR